MKSKHDKVSLMRVLVVGGAGKFGSFYAKLLAENGFEIGICDENKTAGQNFCKGHGFKWVGKDSDLKGFDIVIVSVPNNVALDVIKEIGPKLGKGALLFDFCSVKTPVVKELQKLSKLKIELASIHPLHGPRVKSIAGYPVICINIKEGKKLKAIEDFFTKNGAEFFFATTETHDQILSITQGLTHYTQFVSAAVLKELNVDLKDSTKFGPPNYRLFLSLMSRVIVQDPELYAQIQLSNPANERVWSLFRKQAVELEKICKKHDVKVLERKIIDCAQQFKEHETFLIESDRLVNAINYFIEAIRQRIGKMLLVENLQTGNFHYGKVESLLEQHLIMEEHGKKTRLALNHIRLASKKEFEEWRDKNLRQKHFDYSFLVPKECEKETIQACLSHFKGANAKILEEYESKKLPKGKKSITARVSFFEDSEPKQVDQKIRKTIKELGFSFR